MSLPEPRGKRGLSWGGLSHDTADEVIDCMCGHSACARSVAAWCASRRLPALALLHVLSWYMCGLSVHALSVSSALCQLVSIASVCLLMLLCHVTWKMMVQSSCTHLSSAQRADPPCQVHHHRNILKIRCPLFDANIESSHRSC